MSKRNHESGPTGNPKEEKYAIERAFAEGTIARVNNFQELNADTEDEAHEVYLKKTREVFDYFAVHGRENLNNGNLNIEPYSDLDGKFGIMLWQMAGFKAVNRKFNPDNPGQGGLEYTEKGGIRPGAVHFDTGDRYGITVENVGGGDNRTWKKGKGGVFIDHHGPSAKNDTCATKLIHEALISLGFIEKDESLQRAVDFVNQIDNKSFPLNREGLQNYHKTLYGLAEFLDPQAIIEFFKNGGNPEDILTNEEIRRLDTRKKTGNGAKDLIGRSLDLKKKIDQSVKILAQMEKDGMVINSDSYGKILISIPGVSERMPLGFDTARAYGYGAYIVWDPEHGSFLVNTVNNFNRRHKFSQGVDMRGRHMWIKPPFPKDKSPLKFNLSDVLSILSDGSFNAEGKLEQYLQRELIDNDSSDGKINKNKPKNNMRPREKAPAQEQEVSVEDLEFTHFEEIEGRAAGNWTEQYARGMEIDRDTKRVVDNLLENEIQEKQREFALIWFRENEENVRKERIVPEGASDDWIVNMVLSPRERGGMGAFVELNRRPEDMYNEDYRLIREQIDRIGVLKTDLQRGQIPPETPFLLINHLQGQISKMERKVMYLRANAESDGERMEAESKARELENLKAAQISIASKAMGEDIVGNATRRVKSGGEFSLLDQYPNVQSYVQREAISETEKVARQREHDLIDQQWDMVQQNFLPSQREEYLKSIGFNCELSQDDFYEKIQSGEIISSVAQDAMNSGDPEAMQNAYERLYFFNSMRKFANENYPPSQSDLRGVCSTEFCALLANGHSPSLIQEKRGFFSGKPKYVILPSDPSRKIPIAEWQRMKNGSNNEYRSENRAEAERNLRQRWGDTQSFYNEAINNEIESRMSEIAISPESVEGGIEAVYQRAKDRVVEEYISRKTGNNQKLPTELASIKEKFGERSMSVDIGKFMGDILMERGELANLDSDPGEKIIRFMQELGIDLEAATRVVYETPDDVYFNARRDKSSFMKFMVGLVESALGPVISDGGQEKSGNAPAKRKPRSRKTQSKK